MQIGLIYIGIRRSLDLPISYDLIFTPFNYHIFWRAIGLYLLKILLLLPFAILLVFAITLMMAGVQLGNFMCLH